MRDQINSFLEKWTPAGREVMVYISTIDLLSHMKFAKPGKGRIYKEGDNIDLSRFKQKLGQKLKDPDTGEYLEPDSRRNQGNGPHGGSWWKLKSATGKRIGTISKDGIWLRP